MILNLDNKWNISGSDIFLQVEGTDKNRQFYYFEIESRNGPSNEISSIDAGISLFKKKIY